MNYFSLPSFKNYQKEALIRKNYKEIYTHELAHKRAAGSLGGSIVIEKDSNGIPVGGHVSIKMPKINKNNPQETIKDADTVIKAAMAPSDPSPQDYKVASEAKKIKSEAQHIQQEKRLDYYA